MPRYTTDLRQRSKDFAVAAYGLSKDTRARHPALRNACDQMFDAASSVGANLAENDGLNTRKELAARYAIALREAKETKYWLDVLHGAEPTLEPQTAPLIAECKEFIAMMTTALKKLRT
ncbi:MAG TPA: four helix bundle protein [Vicinamibacterales bacterium]|nr:four helix bundle protein [Vicinamibacterales bacterium]